MSEDEIKAALSIEIDEDERGDSTTSRVKVKLLWNDEVISQDFIYMQMKEKDDE